MIAKLTGYGEVDLECTDYTPTVYEQEFEGADIIGEVYGEVDLKTVSGETVTDEFVLNVLQGAQPDKPLPRTTVALVKKAFPRYAITKIDYRSDHWNAYKKALWAMLRTADEIRRVDGLPPINNVPSFNVWERQCIKVKTDRKEVSQTVFSYMEDGLFHSGDAEDAPQEG